MTKATHPTDSVEVFLAYAIEVELQAAVRFGELADSMIAVGNRECAKLFRKLSDFSYLHLADAKARSGYRNIPVLMPEDFRWPDHESPEQAAIWGADPMIAKSEALAIAYDAERRGYEFYRAVLDATDDPEIRALAKEFVDEEAEHVMWMERWIAEDKAGEREHLWVDALEHHH